MTALKEQVKNKKLHKEEIKFKKAIKSNPNSYENYFNLGLFYYKQDSYDSALDNLKKAIKLNQKYATSYYLCGLCYVGKHKFDLASYNFTKSIELNPDDNTAYFNRGTCYLLQNDYENALSDFTKTIKLNHNYATAYSFRGTCHFNLGNHELALTDFNKAIELNPNDTESYNNRAACYSNLGNQELALADYNDSIGKKSKSIDLKEPVAIDKKQVAVDLVKKIDLAKENMMLNKKLDSKSKELNNLVAMFAHNFLGTLQCIRSNAEHDNNPKIHLKTVKMMGGALTAFSIISADDDKLVEQLKQDNKGETNLLQCLANNLALAISQLLSKTNKDKIINLYLNYLQKTGQIQAETTGEDLRFNDDEWNKWDALQTQWDDEFNALFSEKVELNALKQWINTNFFAIEIIGFDKYPIHFKEYGITDSIFLVVLMETLVNALKYIDVKANKPLILTLGKENNAYQLSCENPSRQESYRGTHKGMDFLQTIAKKLNGEFINKSTENNFKSTFIIPAELLD